MALIVEDGTGKADAESYISVADADAYHLARANTSWADLSTSNKEAFLRRGAEYMLGEYRMRWKGVRVTATQALDWPRYGVTREDYYSTPATPPDSIDGQVYYPSDEVPAEVARACAELALKASTGELAPDLSSPVKREKVGPIEVEYQDGARQQTRYTAIDNMLRPFLKGGQSFLKVQRA